MKLSAKIVKGKTNDLQKLMQHFQKLMKTDVNVGYFEDSGEHSEAEVPYATLMAWHEEGMGNYPSRPVLQGGMFVYSDSPKPSIRNLIGQVGKIDKNIRITAEEVTQVVKSAFGDTYLLADNAESVIASKGRNEPLVDKGELRDHLDYKINKT